jgi:oxaloacetate decarboxylase gamma subunit
LGTLDLAGNEVIQQGVDLMLYGMGVVFVFLTMLVIVTVAMSKVVQRWLPEEEGTRPAAGEHESEVDARIVAIIQAALDKHRSRR